MSWMNRLRSLFRRDRLNHDLGDEVTFHVEMRTRENLAAGMSPEEARYAALRQFGNVASLQEQTRDAWAFAWLEALGQDLKYGLRTLAKNPGFTVVAVLSLALGIGANTAIFSLIDVVMLKMLPVENPQQLTLLNWAAQGSPGVMPANGIIHSLSGNMNQDKSGRLTSTSFSYPTFEQIHAGNAVFSKVFAFADPDPVNFYADGQAAWATAELVSGDYFSGLGLGAVAGRTITEADDQAGAAPIAVISYGYWERRFGHETSAVGKAITVNNAPFTIVGVTPPEFFGLQPGRSLDVWLPLHTQPQVEPDWIEAGRSKFLRGDDWWIDIMGRLRPGVSEQQARAALEVAFQQSMAAQKAAEPQNGATQESSKGGAQAGASDLPHLELAPASKGLDTLRQEFSQPLYILMAVVGLVLLIACANVANLLLARATARQKEIAVRLAIGAGRRRLIRQLLTESVLLATLGGVIGLALAYWATGILVAFMSSGREPVVLSVHPDLRVLGFTAVISVLTAVLFGLAPAFRGTRLDLTPALKESAGRGSMGMHRSARSRLGKGLVIAQVAMSLVLLVGAGLFVRTLQNLENINVGFNRRNILLFGIAPGMNGYQGEKLASFYQELQRRLEALPGVRSVSASSHTLIGGGVSISGISIQGYTRAAAGSGDAQNAVYVDDVGPQFLETMGIPLLLGRTIGSRDTSTAPKVAVINQTLARTYFADSNPIGRRFGFGDAKNSGEIEIVGVVGDAIYAELRKEVPPTVYLPYLQRSEEPGMFFEVRTAGNPMAMVTSVRRAVQSLDKNLPLLDVKTQTEQIDQTLFQERLFAKLSGFFGLLALVLACVGLYGIMSYGVARRTSEMGIRMALGAERVDILGMVMRETLAMVFVGIALGVAGALAATRLVSSMLYGLKASDPLTIVMSAVVMIMVAALAGYLPARRATKVDPMVALRYE
ncbi:MAG TPA: ABC transporter permease [Terriglobia bacterium]|nr:ABC transporter permease [Terriglobia bacterium]